MAFQFSYRDIERSRTEAKRRDERDLAAERLGYTSFSEYAMARRAAGVELRDMVAETGLTVGHVRDGLWELPLVVMGSPRPTRKPRQLPEHRLPDVKTLTAEQYVSLGAAARMLRLSKSTVARMVDAGTLSFWSTPGGHRRFRVSELQAWVNGAGSVNSNG